MRYRVLALVVLLAGPGRGFAAADPTARCVARKLAAAGRTVGHLTGCHLRALRLGTGVDGACLETAARRFAAARARAGRGPCPDDGLERLQSLLAGVLEEAVRRLAPAGEASACEVAKLRAAGARAAAILGAHGRTLAAPRSRARTRKLVRAVARARQRFQVEFARASLRHGCEAAALAFGDAVDATLDVLAGAIGMVVRETVVRPSPVTPPGTPGSPGVTVTNPKLVTQFGGAEFSLNNVTYTRWYLAGHDGTVDAVLVTVPGFGGGAGNFEALAENLVTRLREDHGLTAEVWGFDRRSEQLEDRGGVLLAGRVGDPLIALDWFYGGELGLTLAAGLSRRAVFYNTSDDVPFLANWTNLVFSRDIDVVVDAARFASGGDVFLGGHSAGTGFAARYAATDLNVSGAGASDPGYAKLRGLVLFEGGGGTTSGTPLTDDSLDRIIARHDGGLHGAVRDGAPRCVDGTTPCALATESIDCAAQVPARCTPNTPAHGVILGISPKILAAAEPAGIQGLTDPDAGQAILQVDQGGAGNNAVARVPELVLLAALAPGTVEGLFGSFLDDDGITASVSPAIAASAGALGPVVDGLVTWLDVRERAGFPSCPGPGCPTPDNGPAPATLPATFWGREKEVVRMDRLRSSFAGIDGANASDWYYPISGLGVTRAPGVCGSGACTAGNVGASCTEDEDCDQTISLDSTALSVGRGRPDIENLTQAARIDIPVLCIGGSNGLTSVPARFLPFATSIGTCAAPSCDGTPRVVDETNPNQAFPTLGGVSGGFEVVIAEGFAHIDVVAAEDDADNPVVTALADFIVRNLRDPR